jgi:hypothetical protein
VAVLCDPRPGDCGAKFTTFDDLADAIRFAEALPCRNPHCSLCHIVAWIEHGAPAVEIFDRQRRRSLEAELAHCYPRRRPRNEPHPPSPEFWPALLEHNEPLQPKQGAVQ